MEADCPLCRKLKDRQLGRDELVWEFPHSVALLGPWQFYHGYCVLFARTHARELQQLPLPERMAYLQEMIHLAAAIESAFQPRKLNYELLGNQVPHLHWHLFPRYSSDPDRLKPVWLAIDRAERDEGLRTHMEIGPSPRAETIERLRAELSRYHPKE